MQRGAKGRVLEMVAYKISAASNCILIENRELLLGQSFEICFGSEKCLSD